MGALVTLTAMTALWLLSLAIKDASIVDIFWGLGFVILVWVYFIYTANNSARHWLIAMLVTLWGLRLSIHLAKRNIGTGEDYRYQKWRDEEGQRWWWLSFFSCFLIARDHHVDCINLPSWRTDNDFTTKGVGFLSYLHLANRIYLRGCG